MLKLKVFDEVNTQYAENHKPHRLFCEMDELQSNQKWKEAARWIKFEEGIIYFMINFNVKLKKF
jgi:hypothetical protein